MRLIKIILVVATGLFSSAVFASNPVDVHFSVGSSDLNMTITGFTATGDTDCSRPTTGPGICEDVGIPVPSYIDIIYPKTADYTPGLLMQSANWQDPEGATGTLTLSFNVSSDLGSFSFPVKDSIAVHEGALPTGSIIYYDDGQVQCKLNMVGAASKGAASSLTFSCNDRFNHRAK